MNSPGTMVAIQTKESKKMVNPARKSMERIPESPVILWMSTLLILDRTAEPVFARDG